MSITTDEIDQFEPCENLAAFIEEASQHSFLGEPDFGFDTSSFAFPVTLFDVNDLSFSFPELGNDSYSDPLTLLDACDATTTHAVNSASSVTYWAASLQDSTACSTIQRSTKGSREKSLSPEFNELIPSPTANKRKWQDHINVFSAKDGQMVTPRKRKAFAPSKKRVVALNRLFGACIQCKLRKGEVSTGPNLTLQSYLILRILIPQVRFWHSM
jgi:hypothetical protein